MARLDDAQKHEVPRQPVPSMLTLARGAGFSPAQLTALNLDKSGMLERVIADSYGGREAGLLAEFQYAFITFLLGQSLEGDCVGDA